MSDAETHQRLKIIENRLQRIEEILFTEKKQKWKKSDYKGLSGGIHMMIDNGFFGQPREVKEVIDELKRESYHYPPPSVSKALSVDFTNKKKILTRIREGAVWKYVLRK